MAEENRLILQTAEEEKQNRNISLICVGCRKVFEARFEDFHQMLIGRKTILCEKCKDKQIEEILSGDIPEMLLRKNLFNEICEIEMDKQIVGEIETRKAIFLCAFGSLVENCQVASYNLLVTSSAGSGKDYVVGKVLGILPNETLVKRTRISPAAFTYWHNPKFEPEWTWDGKVFYNEDISESVLNSDVFKVMCSSGSSATIIIKQRAVDVDIKGKPIMITTTATAIPSPELTRRFEFCNMDEGIEQTKKILERHSRYAKMGILPEYNTEYSKNLAKLKRIKVKIPFAEEIHQYFPEKNILMRTKYPRFLDFIKASCAFHQYQRQIDEEGYYIAEGQDYEIARSVLKKLTTNQFMIPLTINQQKIMKHFEQKKREFDKNPVRGEYKGSAQKILTDMNDFLSLNHLQKNLQLLASYGLLTCASEIVGFKELEVFRLNEEINLDFKIPSFEDLKKMEEVF